MTAVVIRLADWQKDSDRAAMIMLLNHYAQTSWGAAAPLPAETLAVLPERWSAHPGAFTLLAFHHSEPAGLANCLTSFSTFQARVRINIHDLVVHEQYQGLGLGRKLLDAVVEESRRRDACQVTLEVRHDNDRARGLYQRFGFKGLQSPDEEHTYFFGSLSL